MRALIPMAALALSLSGCNLFGGRSTFKCPKDTVPCGTGCVPPGAVCCDDGSGKTSSYCTNRSASCYPNDRGCSAAFPSGTTGAYCCGPSGSIGSNDCPEGQRHCGLLCKANGEPCCPDGADCPTLSWDESGCTSAKAGGVGCGVCLATSSCVACSAGSCCSGDPCGEMACTAGPACTGGSSGGGGSCPAVCTSDADCAGFGARHCSPSSGFCGGDGKCHCCFAECSVNPTTGQSSGCHCLGCSSCSGDRMCLGSTCVFKVGGAPCE